MRTGFGGNTGLVWRVNTETIIFELVDLIWILKAGALKTWDCITDTYNKQTPGKSLLSIYPLAWNPGQEFKLSMSQKTRTTVVIKLTNSLLSGMNIFLQIMAIVLFINNLNVENPIGLIYDLI